MTDIEGRESFNFAIDVTLTEDEINARLNRNAEIDRKILDIMADKAAANQGFNADLKMLRKEQVTLLESAKAGKAKLEVSCYQERDDRRGMMLTRRNDNGDIVDERALTAEERNESGDERQGNLFDGGARAPDPDAGDEEGDDQPGDADADAALDEYIAQGGGVSGAGEDFDGDDEAVGEASPPIN